MLESVSWLVFGVDVFLGLVEVDRPVSIDMIVSCDLKCPVDDSKESFVDVKVRSEERCFVDSGDE